MNVPVITLPVGAAGTVTAPIGQAADTNAGISGLGELFSLQIGFALQNLQSGEEGAILGQGLSEEEQQALEELMALIQQLLVIQQKGSQEAEAFLAENGKAMEQLIQKLQAPLPQLTDEWKQLQTKWAEQEPTADETQKLANLLQSFLADKGAAQAKRTPILARADVMPVSAGFHDLGKMIQPLRIQQGLSAYKQEAGVQTQTVQLQTAGLMTQEQTEGLSQHALPNPVATTAGTLQAQTLQAPSEARSYPVPADQFPEQVTRIFVKQLNLTQTNGLHQAKLVLNPQSLGQVNVTITSRNGVITAQFTAETQAGRELLDNQMLHLRTALTQNGLQVDRLEVTQQQASDNLNFQQQREQAKQQQEQQPQQREQQDEQREFVLESLVDDDETAASLWNRLRETSRGIHDLV